MTTTFQGAVLISNAEIIETLQTKYQLFVPYLNEKSRRIWAAIEAQALGWGGVSQVAEATGLSRTTIYVGMRDLEEASEHDSSSTNQDQIRQAGGGRKLVEDLDESLLHDLESLVEPMTLGHPESPLRWTCKSAAKLAGELQRMGHTVSARTVHALLHSLGYSLQANRKTRDGSSHPDRDAQFLHIAKQMEHFQSLKQPAISVDTKKKELIGEFKNPGQASLRS